MMVTQMVTMLRVTLMSTTLRVTMTLDVDVDEGDDHVAGDVDVDQVEVDDDA